MFRIIKLVVSLCSLLGFVWFGMTVNLGERTLFQHIRAIAQSEESEKLVSGTKETVSGLIGGDSKAKDKEDTKKEKPPVVVKERPAEKPVQPSSKAVHPAGDKALASTGPQDSMDATDRQGMRKLIGARRPAPAPAAKK